MAPRDRSLFSSPGRQSAPPSPTPVIVHSDPWDIGPLPGLAERSDAFLGELNLGYRAKRESGRLSSVRLERLDLAALRAGLPDGGAAGLDSRFKFEPLYPRLWVSSEYDCIAGERPARRGLRGWFMIDSRTGRSAMRARACFS